ncbi:YecH family metal-binding protein [Leclercia sp. UBA1284]|uniref:YecH family metal-binding protein n=1 Tax=Leclercia sp. UBA1284 TaxID=1946737 RepID=UPI00257B1A45|nr:YecH family metal-binding protein [Leclercia sp. UBA1284]
MASIHGHEVLTMMIASGERYTRQSLVAAIIARFGDKARFHTCSAAQMTAAELVAFLAEKGKFIPLEAGFTTDESKICKH